jgi:membrane protease subunit HflC
MAGAIRWLLALAIGGAALTAAGERGIGPLLITRADEQKLILLFGEARRIAPWRDGVATKPGPALRIPLLEEVRTLPLRLQHLDAEPKEVITKDQERIVVDDYVIWRIADPVRFTASHPTGVASAQLRIDSVVRADVREVIGSHTLADLLSERRDAIVESIRGLSAERLASAGIEVVDVRINRTELPDRTLSNVYERMKADRDRLARKYRAEGDEEARRIRAEADAAARVIVAEAEQRAALARGDGEARAAEIYAQAYGVDPDFFAFVRSLEAYRKTLGERTTLVLSPRSEFFELLERGPGASKR